MTASPMNFSTVPPCRSSTSRAVSKNRDITQRTDSGSSRSPSAVEPVTSANTSVTILRASCATALGSSAPQKPHRRKRSGFSSRQLGQITPLAYAARVRLRAPASAAPRPPRPPRQLQRRRPAAPARRGGSGARARARSASRRATGSWAAAGRARSPEHRARARALVARRAVVAVTADDARQRLAARRRARSCRAWFSKPTSVRAPAPSPRSHSHTTSPIMRVVARARLEVEQADARHLARRPGPT